ncbi:MAG: bifunctional phosphopantothenoylcysteine decarboxylase/phosphopantothenate--cysteine ligase CoaBC [Candidatus Adiutrix sp.]
MSTATIPLNNWSSPLETLTSRRLALIVTGGVSAYKAAQLARLWVKAGVHVRVVMTDNAARFITPLCFESLTGQAAMVSMWDKPQFNIGHIALADWAEGVVVAPATANFLAKMAMGLADDLASTFFLAAKGPKLAAPAMNSHMWLNPATCANVETLKKRNIEIIAPEKGDLACGTIGDGRLANLETIAMMAARALGPQDLKGKKIAVTSGATYEAWDDIRVLTNRSTGLMGLSLALAAWVRGAHVTLVAGPASRLPQAPLPDFTIKKIESTANMLETLSQTDFQALIMAAAPADFCPAAPTAGKIKKGAGVPSLLLAPTCDILKTIPRRPDQLFIGFAAEDTDLLARAKGKLENKNLDLVAANQAGGHNSSFGADNNHLWLIFKDGRIDEISCRPKFAAAWAIVDALSSLWAHK